MGVTARIKPDLLQLIAITSVKLRLEQANIRTSKVVLNLISKFEGFRFYSVR